MISSYIMGDDDLNEWNSFYVEILFFLKKNIYISCDENQVKVNK